MRNMIPSSFCIAMTLALGACAQPTPSDAATPMPPTQATASGEMRIETIASGLEHPWAVALLPEGGYLVSERPGRLRRIATDGSLSAPIAGVPAVFAQGQGGLLDVVPDPQYASNKRIWLSFAEPGDGGTAGTAVATATLGTDALTDVRVVYRQVPKLEGGMHFGSRIAFDGKGHVFISQGERNQKALAQDLDVLQGKLVRLNLDGTSHRTIRSLAVPVCVAPCGVMAIATCRAWPSTRAPASSGRASTARAAATKSTCPRPARITAGR